LNLENPHGDRPPPPAAPSSVVLARPVRLELAPSARHDPLLLMPVSPSAAALDAGLIVLVTLALPVAAALLELSTLPSGADPKPQPVSIPGKWIDAAIVCGLAAYLCLRHRLPAASLGLRAARPVRQGLWGIATLIGCYGWMFVSIILLLPFLELIQDDLMQRTEMFDRIPIGDAGRQVVLLIAVVIHEELWFRGLLLPYVRRATGSWWIAVAVTSLLFGLLHLPQGFIGALQVAGLSVVLSLFFIHTRSLPAVMLGHFLFNFIQMQLAPLLLKLAERAQQMQHPP
jgi:membrane protease YdiL (CAAX protease family)